MIAIVGGGVRLAAAYRLQSAGYDPQIFDVADEVGVSSR